MTTTPPRIFNEIIDLGEHYLKISKDIQKIRAEINFYNSVPKELRSFYPEIESELITIGEKVGYKIRKIPVPDASYYVVEGAHDNATYFHKLLSCLHSYMKMCPRNIVSSDRALQVLEDEIIKKDLQRLELIKSLPEASELENIIKKYGFNGLEEFLKIIHARLLEAHYGIIEHELYFSHGDLCLSNILFWEDKLYLIDPKGTLENKESIRSPYYDYAKLSQCFFGNYDHNNLLRFDASKWDSFNQEDKNTLFLREIFNVFCEQNKIDKKYLLIIQATFFFSMIPLHSESFVKMRAFLISSIKSLENASR